MGSGSSTQVPGPDPNVPVFALSFQCPDRIRLVMAPNDAYEAVRAAMSSVRPDSVQHEWRRGDGYFEFKLRLFPFSRASNSEEAVFAKTLAMRILQRLHAGGWTLTVSSDLFRFDDLSTWFFRRDCAERPVPLMFCLSLSAQDTLQLIDADAEVRTAVSDAISLAYAPGLQKEKSVGQTVHNFVLCGYPWSSASMEQGVWARRLLLQIVRETHHRGFRLYATGDLKGTADNMFFAHDPDSQLVDERFAMISLNANDRFRLIDCPPEVVEAAGEAAERFWPDGTHKQQQIQIGSRVDWELKLRGHPWAASGAQAVFSRTLITGLFELLLTRGWCLLSTLDISRRSNDKAVFVIRSCRPATLPHWCLSLNETDKLRVIRGSPEIVEMVREVVAGFWAYGVYSETEYYGSHQMKVNGRPWAGGMHNKKESALARSLMCRLLHTFCSTGWHVFSSADVSAKFVHQDNGPDYPIDVHSWFLTCTHIPSVKQ